MRAMNRSARGGGDGTLERQKPYRGNGETEDRGGGRESFFLDAHTIRIYNLALSIWDDRKRRAITST